jgi:recombination protein RecR
METFDKLTTLLARLPGVGRRSAERMALKLVRDPELMRALSLSLDEARSTIRSCSKCGSMTPAGENPCRLCTASGRDEQILCVVDEPGDIYNIEQAGCFRGRYHAMMGRISPMKGDGPAELRLQALLRRIDEEKFSEVVLAMSTDVEGDATVAFLREKLAPLGVKVTRLALGIPAGSGIGYADPVTLARAINGRHVI